MKKSNHRQAGFSSLHVLLILILLGIVGFTGWKVYEANKTANTTNSSTSTPNANTTVAPPTPPLIPEGWVEYKNEELGFKFAYPKEWGDVTKKSYVKDVCADAIKQNGASATGEIYELNFTNNDEKKIFLRTNDYKLTIKDKLVNCLAIAPYNWYYNDLVGKGFLKLANTEFTVTHDGFDGSRSNYYLFGLIAIKTDLSDGVSVSLHSVKDRYNLADVQGQEKMTEETKGTLTQQDKDFVGSFKAL